MRKEGPLLLIIFANFLIITFILYIKGDALLLQFAVGVPFFIAAIIFSLIAIRQTNEADRRRRKLESESPSQSIDRYNKKAVALMLIIYSQLLAVLLFGYWTNQIGLFEIIMFLPILVAVLGIIIIAPKHAEKKEDKISESIG